MLVKMKNVRLAFPQIWEATTVNGEGKPAFSATFIFDKKNSAYKDIDAAINAVAEEKWKTKASAVLKELRMKDRVALHDGDLKADYDGFPGNFFVSSRNEKRPLILDADKTPLTVAAGRPYGGCYVNANVDIWAMDNQYGKRVCATLVGIQFKADGEAFSGAAPGTADDFDSEEDMADIA